LEIFTNSNHDLTNNRTGTALSGATKNQRIFILEALGYNLSWTPAVLTESVVVYVSTSKKIQEQDNTSARVWLLPFKSSQCIVHRLFFFLTLWCRLVGVLWNKHPHPLKKSLVWFIKSLRQNIVSQRTATFSRNLNITVLYTETFSPKYRHAHKYTSFDMTCVVRIGS